MISDVENIIVLFTFIGITISEFYLIYLLQKGSNMFPLFIFYYDSCPKSFMVLLDGKILN